MLLTVFNVYQLCSPFPSTTSRTEETGFFTKTKRDRRSLLQLCVICFVLCTWIPKRSDHPTTPGRWDATYQLSPLVKVLLLSSSFFSTASSSTAVCSKSAETESWGEQEASREDTTPTGCEVPSLSGQNRPSPLSSGGRASCSLCTWVVQAVWCAHRARSRLCERAWPTSPRDTSVCTCAATGWAYCMPCACHGQPASRLLQQVHCSEVSCLVGREARAHTSHQTTYHIPQLCEEQISVSI